MVHQSTCFEKAAMSKQIVNLYTHLKSAPRPTYRMQGDLGLTLPCRCLIIGASGTGKSNLVINIISKINAWKNLIIIAKAALSEPLYVALSQSFLEKGGSCYVSEDISELPPLDEIAEPTCVIFDDLTAESEAALKNISGYFIRGRKRDVSCFYISHLYYRAPKLIRGNCDYIFLKRNTSDKDVKRIFTEFDLPEAEGMEMYRKATARMEDFLLVSLQESDPSKRFRHNF